MELIDVKTYLHVDADITEDDVVLKSFMVAGQKYLESATGKVYDDTNELMNVYIKLYVKQLYETRNDSVIEKALDSILWQVKISGDFKDRDVV